MINKELHKMTPLKSEAKLHFTENVKKKKKAFILTLLQQYTPGAVPHRGGPVWSWLSLWGTARWGQPRPLNELQRGRKKKGQSGHTSFGQSQTENNSASSFSHPLTKVRLGGENGESF